MNATKVDMRHRVETHDGALFVRLSVNYEGRIVKGVQGPMTLAEARSFRDDLTTGILEAECQPQSRAASSAKKR